MEWNIKQIADKIIKESDVQLNDYSVSDRIEDINAEYQMLIEWALQTNSNEPISGAETSSETFNITTEGSNTFLRTIKDVPIMRVDFKRIGSDYYELVTEDFTKLIGGFEWCNMRFFANEKQIFVERGFTGTIRVTYARGIVTPFTEADYHNVTPPVPTFLPLQFRPLLYLKPAMIKAEYYKRDRAQSLRNQYESLLELFLNHYRKGQGYIGRVVTGESGCCGSRSNYR